LAAPKQQWILSKIFGYYPLHLATLLLFAPLFLYSDVFYNGWPTALFHGFLSLSLTQAWAPAHAEVWNAPTWFLSALTFATATLPYCLPAIAALNVSQLVKTGWWIYMAYLLPKLGYAYDFNMWTVAEGITAPKLHPNLQVFNTLRFSPVFAVAEVLLGIVACRIVMLDGTEGNKATRKTNALSTAIPLVAMVGLMMARAVGAFNISDMLFRGIFFVPLFLRFLMAAHRNTVKSVSDPLLSVLNNSILVTLGNLAFPIFIVHGKHFVVASCILTFANQSPSLLLLLRFGVYRANGTNLLQKDHCQQTVGKSIDRTSQLCNLSRVNGGDGLDSAKGSVAEQHGQQVVQRYGRQVVVMDVNVLSRKLVFRVDS
jgi:hypothetical protein